MDVSKFLSKVIGIYLVLISGAMFFNMHQFNVYLTKLLYDEPLMFSMGFFTLIIGILMVVSHNIWQPRWTIIITLLSWLTLFKGLSMILFPHATDNLTTLFIQSSNIAYSAAGFDLVLGLILVYTGFRCKGAC